MVFHSNLRSYRLAKKQRIPYLYWSFPAKEPYNVAKEA